MQERNIFTMKIFRIDCKNTLLGQTAIYQPAETEQEAKEEILNVLKQLYPNSEQYKEMQENILFETIQEVKNYE